MEITQLESDIKRSADVEKAHTAVGFSYLSAPGSVLPSQSTGGAVEMRAVLAVSAIH